MSEFTFNIKKPDEDIKPKVDNDEEEDGGDDGANPEEESTATFKALVQLDKVEVKTEEEDEEVIFERRGLLFNFAEAMLDKGKGIKSWLEKGKGDVKLLKHKENDRIRILMRQEKTLKIIANHFIDPRIKMEKMTSSDRAWVWVAFDFSNGESLVETTFAIKFNNSDIANEFKDAFGDAQTHNKKLMSGADSTEGAAESEELTKLIEKVEVKPEENPEG